ncbi:hypothetical protein T11_3993 [Trichinella zimbabwensis]|uniref:Uncharacterized protein n=1 Tax=Trichinella zimbabwensis TaxID=268475 RepID=A0A0V1HDR1_9BILA|nr:hypothetical protein T11_3993 [Trichinella zimbabwensis]
MLLTIATIDHNTTERKPKLHTTNNCHVPPTYRTPPPIVKSKWACYGSRVQRRRAGLLHNDGRQTTKPPHKICSDQHPLCVVNEMTQLDPQDQWTVFCDSAEGQTNNDRPTTTDSRSVRNVTEDKTNGKDTNFIEQGCNLRKQSKCARLTLNKHNTRIAERLSQTPTLDTTTKRKQLLTNNGTHRNPRVISDPQVLGYRTPAVLFGTQCTYSNAGLTVG